MHLFSIFGFDALLSQISPNRRYWCAFVTTAALLAFPVAAFVYTSSPDHLGSIPLAGDHRWYYNYEVGFEMQDPETFYDGIGTSIYNAQHADIIFLGWSKLLFAMNWQLFEDFERKHHIKMFNLGFAGVNSGEFYKRVALKWGLRPKLWVINADRDLEDYRSGFFFMELAGGGGAISSVAKVVNYSRLHAYKNVVGRNLRWRAKMTFGWLQPWSYRSVETGNWYLDNWPNYTSEKNAAIKYLNLTVVDGVAKTTERGDSSCPAMPEEIDEAREYVRAIGGTVVLIQIPSAFACAQRVHEIAVAIEASALTVDATQFSSTDGGGHLDKISAQKYSGIFFTWLEQLPEFRRLSPEQ